MPPVSPINRRNFCTPILTARGLSADDEGLARCSAALAECLATPVDGALTEYRPSRHLEDPTTCVENALDDREAPNFSTLSMRLNILRLTLTRLSQPTPSANEASMLGILLEKRILSGITDRFLQGYDAKTTEELWQLRQGLVDLKARWKHATTKAIDAAIDQVQQKYIAIEQGRGHSIIWTDDFYRERSKDPEAEAGGRPDTTTSLARLLACEAKELDPSYTTMRFRGKYPELVACWQRHVVHELDANDKLALLTEIFTQGNQGPVFLSTPQRQIMAWRLRTSVLSYLGSEKKIAQQVTNPELSEQLATTLQKILAQPWTETDPDVQRDSDGYDPAALRNALNASITLLDNHAQALRAQAAGPSRWRALIPEGLRFQASIGKSNTTHTLAVQEPYAGFTADYSADSATAFDLEMLWRVHPNIVLGVGAQLDWKHFTAAPTPEPFVDDFHTVSGGPSLAAYFTIWNIPWHELQLIIAPEVSATFGTLVTPEAINVGHESRLYSTKTPRPFCNVTMGAQLLVDIPLPDNFTFDVGFSATEQYLEYADGPLELSSPWATVFGFAAAFRKYF